MKTMKETNFARTFGDVPESFTRRVQETLRCIKKEEKPMKKLTARTILIAAVLALLMTAGLAATVSKTIEFFGNEYGDKFRAHLESGDIDPHSRSIEFEGLTFLLNDVVVVEEETAYIGLGQREDFVPEPSMSFYATGSIAPMDGTQTVIMACDDYQITDPAGYALYYGDTYPQPAEDSPSYAEVAASRGQETILVVRCIANGILNEKGEIISGTVGSTIIPNVDGTVDFSVEICSDRLIHRQDSYRMSLWLVVEEIDLEGNPVGEPREMDWIVTVTPEKANK